MTKEGPGENLIKRGAKPEETSPIEVEILQKAQSPEMIVAYAQGHVQGLIALIEGDIVRFKGNGKEVVLSSLRTLQTHLEGGEKETAFQEASPVNPK